MCAHALETEKTRLLDYAESSAIQMLSAAMGNEVPESMSERTPEISEARMLSDCVLAIAQRQDQASFEVLFQHFAPRVKSFLLKRGASASQAEDLAQETLVSVWRKAKLFDPTKASAAAWIFTIARNLRIDAFRREKRPEIDPLDPMLRIDPEPQADLALEEQQSSAALVNSLSNLSDDDRMLLNLAYYEDKSQSMIASELGIPLGTVKSRMRRVFSKLRVTLSGALEDEI